MTIIQIDRILAAAERAKGLGSIPRDKVVAVVAQSLGITQELVLEAIEREGQPA